MELDLESPWVSPAPVLFQAVEICQDQGVLRGFTWTRGNRAHARARGATPLRGA